MASSSHLVNVQLQLQYLLYKKMLRPGIAALFFFHHDWQNTKYTLSYDRFYFTTDDVHSSLLFKGGGGGFTWYQETECYCLRNLFMYTFHVVIHVFMYMFTFLSTNTEILRNAINNCNDQEVLLEFSF